MMKRGITHDFAGQQAHSQTDGKPTFQVPAHPIARTPAVGVSVMAMSMSHPDPRVSSRRYNLQLAYGVSIPKQLSRTSNTPVKYLASPALAGVEGGFTLPSNVASTSADLNGGALKQDPVSGPSRESSSYSAASLASISAQCLKTMLRKSEGDVRRSKSTPSHALSLLPSANNSKYKYQKVVGGKILVCPNTKADVSPQIFLDRMIRARGYSTANFCSLDGGYYCKPTPLQKASYGLKMIQAVKSSDIRLLKRLLDCGLSPNPANQFGESLVHMVCRRGDHKLLKVLLDAGCSLQVTDDFGRTPLHDACWTSEPCFECVELILNKDERLLHVVDCRGASPLSYIKREHWEQWIAFFKRKVEQYWAPRDVAKEGEETPPALVGAPPHSRPIPDPQHAIPVEVASLVSSGQIDPDEVLRRKKECATGNAEHVSQTETAPPALAATAN